MEFGAAGHPFGPHSLPSSSSVERGSPPWLAMVSCPPPDLLTHVHIMGAGPGPLMFSVTAQEELLVSPFQFYLNPLLKTSRFYSSFSLAHLRKILRVPGSKSTIKFIHGLAYVVMGLTLRPILQMRTPMVQVVLSHQLRIYSWERTELVTSLPTSSLRILS